MSDAGFSKPPPPAKKKMSRSDSTKLTATEGKQIMDAAALQKAADDRRGRLMGTIMLWSKNIFHTNIVSTSKAFYLWKFANMKKTVDEEDKCRVGEQKNSYLLLFAENERLREQLNESRKMTLVNEKSIRASAVKSMISIIFRSRLSSKIRYYFDIWQNNSKMIKMVQLNAQRTMQLEVGLQTIESNRNNLKKTESINSSLKLQLVLTVYFYKWKSKIALTTLAEERKLYEQQRKIIYKDLQTIRETVTKANKQEVALLHTSLVKGQEIVGNISALREQLGTVESIYKANDIAVNNTNGSGGGQGRNGMISMSNSNSKSVTTSSIGRKQSVRHKE